MKSSFPEKRLNIAIVGAGTAGLMQAIALMRQFGQDVKISLFEKHSANDWEQRGIELGVGPAFQIACRYVGMNIEKFREDHGNAYEYDPAFMDKYGNRIPEMETQMKGNHTSGVSEEKTKNGTPLYEMREYSVHRRDLMNFIVEESKRISLEEKTEYSMNFGTEISNISVDGDGRVELKFAGNSAPHENRFDLVIGADGVHSKVRTLCLEKPASDILPTHIGANILYGFIPNRPDFYHPHRFNVSQGMNAETGEQITLVMSGLKGNDTSPTDDSLWWAIIYPDQKGDSHKKIAFWDKEKNTHHNKKIAEDFQKGCNHDLIGKLIELTPLDKFLYAGKFLERDYRDLKDSWGKDCIVLIGDAVHALMPWAAVGAGLAAEDAIILAELLKDANIIHALPERGLFNKKCNEVFSRLSEIRRQRIHYFTELTRAFVPNGILPPDSSLENSIKQLNAEFGDQHILNTSPFWKKLIDSIPGNKERERFFYINRENELQPSSPDSNKGYPGLTFWKNSEKEYKSENDLQIEENHCISRSFFGG